jgi:predicted TPR repeat methyltransferase
VGEKTIHYARLLVGVDLSQAMLDQSSEKHIYHQLHRSDISEFLRATEDQYDLITCMDTFIYAGRLEEILELIYQKLKPGGKFLFSTEKLLGAYEHSYKLNISGRYSHHQDHLTEVLNKTGFKIQQINDVAIRTESGCPIEGQFVCVCRAAKENGSDHF